MPDIVLRRAALNDLDAIARYTTRRWSKAQSRKYIAALRDDILSLNAYPRRHALYGGRLDDIRKMPSGQHLVFYRLAETRIEILRVLHSRSDFSEAFD